MYPWMLTVDDVVVHSAMIVTGWNQARADPVVWELLPRGFDLKWHSVSAEPSLSDVAEGESPPRCCCCSCIFHDAVFSVRAMLLFVSGSASLAARRLIDV